MPKLEKINEVRHSLAHLLAAAVLKKFPKAKLGIGPVIENGFYYDFKLPRPLTEVDLRELEHTMRALVMEKLPFSGKKISPAAAKKLFKDQPFKLDLIKEFQKDKKPLTVYITGKAINAKYQIPDTKYFVDLCRGGHVKNTGEINSEGFKLTSIAGAYWRGNEKNPQLQRIYGLAFGSGKELKDYETLMEEAKKRDHRKLGKELKLFTIVDKIGAGLPLFYPKGAILRRIVENFIIEMQEKRGYVPIWIPHITKGELYKISGHLDKYDAMYPPMKLKGEADYYLKPMNCPHFMMLYKSEPHSYKELPIRMTSTTTNYRYEKSGELSGLTRVRSLTQDDCHVFSAPEQIEGEINLMLDMIDETYSAFRFKDFWVRISTHDPKDKDKYIGDPKIWKQSENILEKLITKRGWKNEVVPGEAAFYGPKLDFMAKDVLGREWQLSTIQLDMNLPKRFGLEYIDEKGNKRQPIVIHRAILGSTERFLGILIEHYGGDFPVWLSPIQARIIPISDRHREYAEKILKALKDSNVRSDIAPEGETLGKNIRGGELEKIPYLLVVGDKEIEEKSVNVRERHKKETFVSSVEKFIERIKKEEKDR